MKYWQGKIKTEHHILKEFQDILHQVAQIPEVQKIIPGRISRQQKGTSDLRISFSYFTKSWLKYKLKKWATAQELFIVCSLENKEIVKNKIQQIIENIE